MFDTTISRAAAFRAETRQDAFQTDSSHKVAKYMALAVEVEARVGIQSALPQPAAQGVVNG
jgi:hypothetical protein